MINPATETKSMGLQAGALLAALFALAYKMHRDKSLIIINFLIM